MTNHAVGFETLDREVSVDRLPVQGELPPWLSGSLIRTGPARFEANGRSLNHWFDGQAMLHRFSFGDGGVAYANRAARDPGRRRRPRRADRLQRVRHRSLPVDLPAHGHDVLAGGHRQRQREPGEDGRAVRGDDRDPAAGRVRPAHPARAGRGRVGARGRSDHDRPSASRPGARRTRQLRHQARAAQQLPRVRSLAERRGAADDRSSGRAASGLHAQLRLDRALRRPGRISVRGRPAAPRVRQPPVHRELPLGARARDADLGDRPRRRRGSGPV